MDRDCDGPLSLGENTMSLRNGLLGLAAALVAAGDATAAPNDPHVEGRVSDPVAQEFYQPEIILAGFRSVPMPPTRSIPATVGITAVGAATAVPTSPMGHAGGASLASGFTGSSSGISVGEMSGGVPHSILNSTTVPLGTVPIVD